MSLKRSAAAEAAATLLEQRSPAASGQDLGVTQEQWDAFVNAGFPWAAIPEERGGPGGTITDAADILREIGRTAAAVPAGDTNLLAEWLLATADLACAPGLVAVAPGLANDNMVLRRHARASKLTGTAHRVPWASRSDRFVALLADEYNDTYVVSVPTERLQISPGRSLAGESRDTVVADDLELGPGEFRNTPTLSLREHRGRGAAVRTIMIDGAIQATVKIVREYCSARTQFGRRLCDFQVVGHNLALLAEQAILVSTAAAMALATLDGSGSWEDAAAAKIVAGEAATHVARSAHQLHGAIGVSAEYALHRFTRRLWAWRDEYGSESEWATHLGTELTRRGPDMLWPWVSHAGLVSEKC